MKKPLPIGLFLGIIAFAIGGIAFAIWKDLSAVPPGPSEEVLKNSGPESIKAAIAKGPPAGPPLPGGDRNPMLKK